MRIRLGSGPALADAGERRCQDITHLDRAGGTRAIAAWIIVRVARGGEVAIEQLANKNQRGDQAFGYELISRGPSGKVQVVTVLTIEVKVRAARLDRSGIGIGLAAHIG